MPSPRTKPPGHLWRDTWTALSGPLSLGRHALYAGFQQYNCSDARIIRGGNGRFSRGYGFVSIRNQVHAKPQT